MFPAKPFDIRRKVNRKWHEPRHYTRQDPSLNNTMPVSMLKERRESRNSQFEKRHKLIHDAIMAGELIQNEERKEKLAAKLRKRQEDSKVQDEKEDGRYLYSYKLGDLPASMFKLNFADIDENVPEKGEGSKNEVNSGTTTRNKGKGRTVEDELDGVREKYFFVSDMGSQEETKPYSSQYRFQAEPRTFELPKDAEINRYRLKPLPVPPEFNISRSERGGVQMWSNIKNDAKCNVTQLDKGIAKAMDITPEESGQSEREFESKNQPNLGSTKIDKGKGRALGDIIDKFPNPPTANSSRDEKRKVKASEDKRNTDGHQYLGFSKMNDNPILDGTKFDK
ncbi:hypothetical protein RUND412_004031 [Rhizina undulata]